MTTESITKIDSKLPLPWLLVCTATIAIALGGVFAKLDTVSATLKDVQSDIKARDANQVIVNQTVALQDVAIKQVQAEVTGLKSSVAELQRNQRFYPK